MPNVIELVNKYLPILDEQYRVESKTAILDTPAEFVQQTREAKKIKIAKIRVDGLADYSRQNGFTTGSMDLTWEEHEFRIDRGRALQIDALDNIETFGLAWGRLSGTFQRDKVVPEMDAYRFAQYYQKAGIKKNIALTADNVFKVIDDIIAAQDDAEVPEDNKVIFVNPTVYKHMINDTTFDRYITVDDNATKALNKKIYAYNGMPIIKVPTARFYTKIELLKGDSSSEAGGYKMATGASAIGLMIISKPSVIQISKRVISRYWAPTRAEMVSNGADGVNPNADAWKFDFRAYHDAWVLEEKYNGIAAVTIDSSSVGVTSVEITTSDSDVTLTGTGATKTASISLASVDTFLAEAKVVVKGDASTAVTWSTSANDVATVDSAGNVVLLKTGSAVITATSIYDPSKSAKVTITVTA